MNKDLTIRLLTDGNEVFMLSGEIKSEIVDGLDTKIYWDGGGGPLDDWLKRGGAEFNKSEKSLREAQEYLMHLAEEYHLIDYRIVMEVHE